MAIPVARVHLKVAVAHAALPALLPTPPNWKMLPSLLLPTPCPCAAAIPRKPLAKPSRRADSDERWDARKTKSATSSASSSPPSSTSADSVRSSAAGRGSGSCRRSATSPPPKPCRVDSAQRWDAHKKKATASPAASSSTSSSSLVSSATSAERWDVHKKRCPLQAELLLLDDGEGSSTASNDIDIDTEEEEILWKPRAMYAGPGFAVAAPEPRLLPMPTSFLVPVA